MDRDYKSYTNNELMVAAVSKELRDGELGFVGVGTAGRGFTLAVGIPMAAARLAQYTHAPNYEIFWGEILCPDLSRIPGKFTQDNLTKWPAAFQPITCMEKCQMVTRGEFDVSFDSAPQVDQFGNLNITAIGEYKHPDVRLIGCLAQPDHFAFVKRPIIVTDLKKRTFVEKVDFITSAGYLDGGDSREKQGLKPYGPWKVITDKCVFNFNNKEKRMQLESLHPGVALEDVLDHMGFVPVIPEKIPMTKAPTEDEVKLIREEIDPNKVLLRA